MCDAYGVDQKALLERAPLPADFFENEGPGGTTRQFFECWSLFHSFMGDANMALEIGRASVHGPFHSAGYAFSCSETIEAGLERLAVFKPLVGPFDLQLARTEDGLMVRPGSVDDRVDVPPSLVALEVGYFIESFRVCTGHNVVPLRLEIPSETPG